jgi:predicted CXXCH cytochrome family protein
MKRHVLHPLWVAIGIVVLIFVARVFIVPDDFGVHGASFTYNYYRLSNEQEWKDFPVKYQGYDTCTECHRKNVRTLRRSPHRKIECESCHGPAVGHPDVVEFLPRNTDRALCLRCHASLEYPNSARSDIPPISTRLHYRRQDCVECHYPHDPTEYIE